MKSNCREGILSDSVDSKSFVENLVRNNSECTGFFKCFSVFFLYDMYFQTQYTKFKIPVFPFGNDSQIPLIEYSKTTNSTASLVAAISKK